ncbi:MAG: S-layer homology domain-containing protein, partial [Oscillospiraceae bacterium]|nr:S-layer homology domain-containing protein [Oscillospiraceae bacterium]
MTKRLLSVLLSVCALLLGMGTARAASGFTDVDSGAYYAAAVDWAVANGITMGTTQSTFSPNRICTESEILTFLQRANGFRPVSAVSDAASPCTRSTAVTYLWQAAGSPEAAADAAFTDIPADNGYREAVAWAVENQVTNGTGDGTTFSPNDTCTRAQIVTFLYRARDIWATASDSS